MVSKTKEPADSSSRVRLAIIGGLVAVLGGGLIWFLHLPPPQAQLQSATPEAKAYVRFLRITEPELKEVSSYMALAKIYEITGKITNTGDRKVSSADLNCIFKDPYGQIVLRQRVPLIKAAAGGLKPGETREFRLPFENMPESWNQGMPDIVIAHIDFGS